MKQESFYLSCLQNFENTEDVKDHNNICILSRNVCLTMMLLSKPAGRLCEIVDRNRLLLLSSSYYKQVKEEETARFTDASYVCAYGMMYSFCSVIKTGETNSRQSQTPTALCNPAADTHMSLLLLRKSRFH
ncbi:hypothetical protein T03_15771 [Trichinella britovi]|uniref:Uncharacterized protein n=1 Tax=Trichinella britovi TaxID=45882 RepID=A0A0V1CLD2_TRIBR|nr:hypothetical protein T03_15771 [Trichinella britovi]